MESAVNDEGESAPAQVADKSVNVEEEVISQLTGQTFWDSISEDDRILLKMRMSGKTQQEIADALGYKSHSAVTKRLQKLKVIFENSNQ
jgi:DNA-binding CsgD family transcriptional regulator